jgi:hypothetical protein
MNNVKGDGHCFYRAIYNILQESTKGKEEMELENIDEYEGVENIRFYISNLLINGWETEAIESIHNICDDILKEADEDLYSQLNEIYPFVNKEMCKKKKPMRIKHVASLIEDMENPMYASQLEMDIIKRLLESIDNTSLIVISRNNESVNTLQKNGKKI